MADITPEIKQGLDALKTETLSTVQGFKEESGRALKELGDALRQEMAEKMAKGFVSPDTEAKIDRIFARIDQIDAKMSAPDSGGGRPPAKAEKSAGETLLDSDKFKNWQKSGFTTDRRMTFPVQTFQDADLAPLSQKAIIRTGDLGSGTSGVLMPQRLSELISLPKMRLMIRDLMRVRRLTQGNSVDWLKQNVYTNAASPQAEGAAKAESTLTYTTATSVVRTIAHWIQVTRQALDDFPGLREDIDEMLMYGLKLVEEREILRGDNLGDHLNGIITQATAYSTALNVSGDTKLDKIRHAIYQSRLALYPVDGLVLHPKDLHDIELIKTEEGGANKGVYIVGDPRSGAQITTIWGKPVVESDAMTIGTFLTGSFAMGALLFDRQQAVIDISLEHGTNFTENEATIRAEERIALAVIRPASFVYGTF